MVRIAAGPRRHEPRAAGAMLHGRRQPPSSSAPSSSPPPLPGQDEDSRLLADLGLKPMGSAAPEAVQARLSRHVQPVFPQEQLEVGQRPEHAGVIDPAGQMLCDHPVDGRSVHQADAPGDAGPVRRSSSIGRSAPRNQSPTGVRNPALRRASVSASSRSAAAARRIAFPPRRSNNSRSGNVAVRAVSSTSMKGIRPSTPAAIIIRSPRSSRLSGSQPVWSASMIRRRGGSDVRPVA